MSANSILGAIGTTIGGKIKEQGSALDTHKNDTDNPHSVTKAQVSLGNVENIALSTWAGSSNITTVGSLTDLTVTGDLTVSGTTTTLNTETVEIEDNIIELNLVATDGSKKGDSSGVDINRGGSKDKASLLWDDNSSNWSVKLGSALTDFKASNVDANVVKVPDGSGITINNVSLGNFASFDNAFTSALA